MRYLDPVSSPARQQWFPRLSVTLARALALFFGGFSLLNLAGEWIHTGFDATLWWLDLRTLPPALASVLLAFIAFWLIAFALRPVMNRWRRRLTAAAASLALFTALANSVVFYRLLWRGVIEAGMPVPFSIFVVAAFALILRAVLTPVAGPDSACDGMRLSLALAVCLAVFPLAQLVCFGKTDYRRPADVVVVFGARVFADGRLSDALADRVRTGCQLYLDGCAKKVLFSGGPGDGAIHETEAMREMAISLGVPAEAIQLDRFGLNTQATVRNTKSLFEQQGVKRVLAVSHFYHLPRIKLAYQRAGLDVWTVPARETCFLTQIPYSMAREVMALWVYYLRPLATTGQA